MGIWPFGREENDVESASRIVTSRARDGVELRGKVTLHFVEPQSQAEADRAADASAALAERLLGALATHQAGLEDENQLIAALASQLPLDIAATRLVELAALHVVGDPGASSRRPTTVHPPPGAPPASAPRRSASSTSMAAMPSVAGPPPRRSSSTMRAVRASLLPPPGSSVDVVGASIAPLVKDAAARLLIGCLRGHDLVAVRRVTLDAETAELFAALVPASDAPPGEFEASRAVEVARWRGTLGDETVFALRHEARAASLFLLHTALIALELPQRVAGPMLDTLATAAFDGQSVGALELDRYAGGGDVLPVRMLAERAAALLGHPRSEPLGSALAGLLEAVKLDLTATAQLARGALGP